MIDDDLTRKFKQQATTQEDMPLMIFLVGWTAFELFESSRRDTCLWKGGPFLMELLLWTLEEVYLSQTQKLPSILTGKDIQQPCRQT